MNASVSSLMVESASRLEVLLRRDALENPRQRENIEGLLKLLGTSETATLALEGATMQLDRPCASGPINDCGPKSR